MIAPLLAALALGASCAATPVRGEPLPQSGSLSGLWIVRHPRAGGLLALRGRRLDGPGVFRQSFPAVYDASEHPATGREYASIVVIPSGGCWRLDIASGRARGSLVVRAVEP